MDIYREQILDHYQNPRNWGRLKNPTHSAEVYNDFCGDKIIIDLLVEKGKKKFDQAVVKDIAFESEGCAISGAAASMLSEQVKGKKIERLKNLQRNDMLKMLGVTLTPVRLKCALLPLEALQKAIGKNLREE